MQLNLVAGNYTSISLFLFLLCLFVACLPKAFYARFQLVRLAARLLSHLHIPARENL